MHNMSVKQHFVTLLTPPKKVTTQTQSNANSVHAQLYRFSKTGSLDPPPYGGRKPTVSTDFIISRIKEMRVHDPGIFAWEIRKR